MANELYASHHVSLGPAYLEGTLGTRFVVLVPGVVDEDEAGVPREGRPRAKLERRESTRPSCACYKWKRDGEDRDGSEYASRTSC